MKKLILVGLIELSSLVMADNLDNYVCAVTSIILPGNKEIKLSNKKQKKTLFAFKMDDHSYIIDNDGNKFIYLYSDSKNDIDIYEDKSKDQFLVGEMKEDNKDTYFYFGFIGTNTPNKMVKGICMKKN